MIAWLPGVLTSAVCILTIMAAAQDMVQFRIANALPAAIIMLFLLAVCTAGAPLKDVFASVSVFLAVFAVGAGLFVLGVWGGGDVKLLAALSLWVHPDWVFLFLAWVALAGGGVAFLLFAGRHLPRKMKESHSVIRRWFANENGSGQTMPYGLAIMIGTIGIWWRGHLGPPGIPL